MPVRALGRDISGIVSVLKLIRTKELLLRLAQYIVRVAASRVRRKAA